MDLVSQKERRGDGGEQDQIPGLWRQGELNIEGASPQRKVQEGVIVVCE